MKSILFSFTLFFSLNIDAQIVNIPDANFKSCLLGFFQINTNTDNEIQLSEAIAFTGGITCTGLGIVDLTGIEAFTSLTELNCGDNQLTSLDLSNNTALIILDCYNINATSLDLSQNTSLEYLYCGGNQLTSINVSQSIALTKLYCDVNQLTSLDLSNNTALTELFCNNNQLTTLDLSNNTALNKLACNDNQLTSLDVSQSMALTELDCHNNNLTALDLSNNTALPWLWCSYNQLTSLDLSNNTALNLLLCNNNQLECLNVKNGNNSNFTSFFASSNINLNCIEVDDVAWSTSNWTNIDAGASFSANCNNACSTVGLQELSTSPKQLIRIVDLIGRETDFKANTLLVYLYSDGATEKVFKFE